MKDSFVYIWTNLKNNKKYIGYHKGSKDDGYICSSHNPLFWNDWLNEEMIWERKIVFEGNQHDCLKKEQEILKNIDIRSDNYYNNARGKNIIWTKEVRKKASKSQKQRWKNTSEEEIKKIKKDRTKITKNCWKNRTKKELEEISKKSSIGMKNYWKSLSEDKKLILIEKARKARIGMNIHSEDYKQYLSEKLKGNNYGSLQTEATRKKKRKRFIENNPGKNKTEETKRKISESKKGMKSPFKGTKRKIVVCPHCGKKGGEGIMNRWHFDNCKNKK